ncbi:MAG: class I tRNA ligase family protein, partial [Candidatus Bathyarchaeia archaeon]
MRSLPKDFNVLAIEEKWQRRWEELGVYRFCREDEVRSPFVIDTPPPYPSGDFHMGNVLNWTYFDIVARFKRMLGYNVLFPQGWDCHGLPTEVEAEEFYGVKKTEVPPEEFRRLCEEFVKRYIEIMKRAIIRLGCSIDWNLEYRTMDPDYWRRTQLSFIDLYDKGYIYKGKHPVNWCPRCVTAIADAEVEHETREGRLHYINFMVVGGENLLIATTRPELIPSCVAVAVHPSDERYTKYLGKSIKVPLFGREVPIIGDESVDPDFGTGVVMICTYGDKNDVKTVAKNSLPVIISLDEEGKMNENAGKYKGLRVEDARKAIINDTQDAGCYVKSEVIKQEVGVCWRCKTPVEILERTQWFMKTRVLTDRVEVEAYNIVWYPEHMRNRLIDWARSLDWDWVLSRQRIFATPIPIWYCEDCEE